MRISDWSSDVCSSDLRFSKSRTLTPTPLPLRRRGAQANRNKQMSTHNRQLLLDPGFELTLRPMRDPQFYEMYRNAIRNTWTVEEVDFSLDTSGRKTRLGPAERHLIERLIAFFATGDSIVSNNLVLNLYQHIDRKSTRLNSSH